MYNEYTGNKAYLIQINILKCIRHKTKYAFFLF